MKPQITLLVATLLPGGIVFPVVAKANPVMSIQLAQSPTPVTYMTQLNPNEIMVQITEGEFRFRGKMRRTSGNKFSASDGRVRVMYDRDTSQVVVINEQTGTEFYNYVFSMANEGVL